MKNQINSVDETTALLAQLFIQPSNTLLANRFVSAPESEAPCAATCSGQCTGFV